LSTKDIGLSGQKLIQKIVYVLGKPSFIYLTIDEAREDFKSCDIAFECIG